MFKNLAKKPEKVNMAEHYVMSELESVLETGIREKDFDGFDKILSWEAYKALYELYRKLGGKNPPKFPDGHLEKYSKMADHPHKRKKKK